MICFGVITFNGFTVISTGKPDLVQYLISGSALLLTVFMAKSLFAIRKAGEPRGVEVTSKDEPLLFKFLHALADEIGAPRPHRVFITAEVNAAVFYDLSLLNLFLPSKKNLIIGLGLVNVLTLGELKAVLAHEFGHFAQGSMMVGRWVYIAQQIISHMVATRDWLDSLLKFVSRIDLRVAWLGWILTLVLWSIRSLMDSLFKLIIIAERALSREMEFNVDLVAVSVTGSDALINALHKLQAADDAWQTALRVADNEAGQNKILDDLFTAQTAAIKEMRRILDDPDYGATPELSEAESHTHRVFSEQSARPPQMWATHPANRDREDNAKATYIAADIDSRQAWELFEGPAELRNKISMNLYSSDEIAKMEKVLSSEAVAKRFDKPSYSPEYRGTYLNRSPVINFSDTDEIIAYGIKGSTAVASLDELYPEHLAEDLEVARNLDIERDTLEALQRGDLKPSGGVIRYRGEEIRKNEIPEAIKEIVAERKIIADKLKFHDANCRQAHLFAAEKIGYGWKEYLVSIIHLLHCAEHICARVDDEHALFINTWQIITADGRIGWLEKKRLMKVCKQVQTVMNEASDRIVEIKLSQPIAKDIGVEDWAKQCPTFDIVDVDKKNWGEWCPAASDSISQITNAMGTLRCVALEDLIRTEQLIRKHFSEQSQPEQAPTPASSPQKYPLLIPGNENVLQRKLDLWNRFQLAHGVMPSLARVLVSLGIVGGTIYGGIVGI
jgi:Zn-dependent protease with chaperone function